MTVTGAVKNDKCESKTASVVLEISTCSESFKISSALCADSGHDVVSLSGEKHVRKAYLAWESACFSGLLYVRKRVPSDTVSVIVTHVAGRLERGDATGFAVAASAAFLSGMGYIGTLSEKDLAGWTVSRLERNPSSI